MRVCVCVFQGNWNQAWIRDSLVVGRILSKPRPEGFVGQGLWLPFSHGLTVIDTTFVNYDLNGMCVVRPCAWCAKPGSPNPNSGGFETRFQGITKVMCEIGLYLALLKNYSFVRDQWPFHACVLCCQCWMRLPTGVPIAIVSPVTAYVDQRPHAGEIPLGARRHLSRLGRIAH